MIEVIDLYFKKEELIRARGIDSDYEDFMILSTECPKRYGDFITVNNTYFGDTAHYEDVLLSQKDFDEGDAMTHSISPDIKEKFVNEATESFKKSSDFNGTGFVYVCQREDDDFAIGICVSSEPLRKAKLEEWEML